MLTASTRKLLLVGNETRATHRKAVATSTAAASMLEKSEAELQRAVLRVDSDSDEEEELYDPLKVLGTDREHCRHVTELHLGKKKLRRVPGLLQAFVNLEELWLNGNMITELRGLLPVGAQPLHEGARGCNRLRRLYLQNNELTTVDGDLERLPYLEVLHLAGNRLSGMDVTVKRLGHLRRLTQLSLSGNPLAEEANYRLFVIFHVPSVEIFDRETVTAEERQKAVSLFGKGAARLAPRHAFGTAKPTAREMQRVQPMSQAAEIVESRVRAMRLRDTAARQAEATRDEHTMTMRRDKRRLFHSVWPAQGGPVQPADSGNLMSPLFDPADHSSDAARLIDLAREREDATQPEVQQRLDARIAVLRARLAPERDVDHYAPKYAALQDQGREAATKTEDAALLRAAYSSAEMDKVRRLYAESGRVLAQDASTMLAGLTVADRLPDPHAVDALFIRVAGKDASLDIAAALRLLADHEPFVAARIAELQEQANASLVKALPTVAAAALQRINALTSHQHRLQKGGGPKLPVTVGGQMDTLLARHPSTRRASLSMLPQAPPDSGSDSD